MVDRKFGYDREGKTGYQVVWHLYQKEFEEEVAKLISEGWFPCGGIHIDRRGNFYQSLYQMPSSV